jgi:hypothetical protein
MCTRFLLLPGKVLELPSGQDGEDVGSRGGEAPLTGPQ